MNKKLMTRMVIMIIALVIVFGAVFAWDGVRAYFMHRFFATFQPPPVTISATTVKTQSWQPYINAVGTLKAVNGVDLSPEVSGIIEKIYFKSGQMVTTGQALFKLNDSIEQADLENYTAQLSLDKLTYQRNLDLIKKKAVSQAELDAAAAKLKQSQAQVNKEKALIAQKNIAAPFAGMIGIRNVNLGQYVSAGTTMVSLQALAPIYVNFYIPEQNLPRIYLNQAISVNVDTYPKQVFTGKITAINAEVDVKTHNILVQATLPNKEHKLYPGLFANIHIILPQQKNVITVPDTAVTFSLFGNSVYVIETAGKDKKGKPILRVKEHYVKTGDSRGNQVVILQGLKSGDQVVTSGQLKLSNDTRVNINNAVNLNK